MILKGRSSHPAPRERDAVLFETPVEGAAGQLSTLIRSPSIKLMRYLRVRYPNRGFPKKAKESRELRLLTTALVLGDSDFLFRRADGIPPGTRGRFNFEQRQIKPLVDLSHCLRSGFRTLCALTLVVI